MDKTRDIKPFGLRLPERLREWVRECAHRERRSMNGHLVHLVETAKQQAETQKAA